jgi:hypothetical protein
MSQLPAGYMVLIHVADAAAYPRSFSDYVLGTWTHPVSTLNATSHIMRIEEEAKSSIGCYQEAILLLIACPFLLQFEWVGSRPNSWSTLQFKHQSLPSCCLSLAFSPRLPSSLQL